MRKISILFITTLTLLVAIASGMGIYAILDAIDRYDRGECETWKDEARMYPPYDRNTESGYYILKWQKAQCDYHGIEIKDADGHKVYVKN